MHARQALILGVGASLIFFLVLAFPLIAVIAIPSLSTGATIEVYAAGLVADVIVAILLLLVGLRYSARAARGELFSIPIVTPIADRWLRLKRP